MVIQIVHEHSTMRSRVAVIFMSHNCFPVVYTSVWLVLGCFYLKTGRKMHESMKV